jgi:hypothetical protein
MVAALTAATHSLAAVMTAPAAAPRSLSRQVRDSTPPLHTEAPARSKLGVRRYGVTRKGDGRWIRDARSRASSQSRRWVFI